MNKPSDDKPQGPDRRESIVATVGEDAILYLQLMNFEDGERVEVMVTPANARSSVAANDIHMQAMYDLVRSFGWSEWSSKPPVAFIMERIAVSATATLPPEANELAGMARDARRYRFIRSPASHELNGAWASIMDTSCNDSAMDEAIDKAMRGEYVQEGP